MKTVKSNLMYRVEQAVSLVPTVKPDKLEWYVKTVLVGMFESAWHFKKNRTHIQEIVDLLDKKYPELELAWEMNRKVGDFKYPGWNIYDYRQYLKN